jgi:hypothetical protein
MFSPVCNRLWLPVLQFVAGMLLLAGSLTAQNAPRQKFYVVSLPAIIKYDKKQLNLELSALTAPEAVLALIRSKNFPAAKLLIGIQKDSLISIPWTIPTTKTAGTVNPNRIVLQSKDIPVSRITDPADFKKLLRDTLVIIDSLVLELAIHDDDFPPTLYQLQSACVTGTRKNFSTVLPYRDGQLIFLPQSVAGCNGVADIKLLNKESEERTLASCRLIFLNREQKETLLSWAAFVKASYPSKSLKAIAESASDYVSNNLGHLPFDQLVEWLQNNLR